MEAMRLLMSQLGLTVNEQKTRLVKLPDEHFDFLGYTVGQFHGKNGRVRRSLDIRPFVAAVT